MPIRTFKSSAAGRSRTGALMKVNPRSVRTGYRRTEDEADGRCEDAGLHPPRTEHC